MKYVLKQTMNFHLPSLRVDSAVVLSILSVSLICFKLLGVMKSKNLFILDLKHCTVKNTTSNRYTILSIKCRYKERSNGKCALTTDN